VHDSIVIDVHPDEYKDCITLLKFSMQHIKSEAKRRYDIEYDMPVDIELKIGKNWLDLNLVEI
jgi:DNA polymerase I-like protein with 3'-5' exonuclease and polymerase domains